jgi:hypothetical protein
VTVAKFVRSDLNPARARRRVGAVLLAERDVAVVALVAIVGGSALLRWAASLAHVVPYYFADEYIYSALARGIADHGRPVVRGADVAFPALLEPLLTAPFYTVTDISHALLLTQALHAVEMSLAAVPVFLLARRLGLAAPTALGCAGVAVASPALFWSSFATADAVAYTLALSAIYAAVCVLDRPRFWTQAAFVSLAGTASFARAQYLVLFLVLPVAALVVERGNVRRVARSHWLTLAVLVFAATAVAVIGFFEVLGPYSGFLGAAAQPRIVAASVGLEALIVGCAAGIVAVPGAVVGLDLLLTHPRTRAERGFAALSLFCAFALVGLSSLIASLEGASGTHERYLIALIPLPIIFCAVWIDRGMLHRRAAYAVAGLGAGAYAAIDLTSWRADHSSTLFALKELEGVAGADSIVRAVTVCLALGAIPLMWRFRSMTPIFAVTIGSMIMISFGAFAFDRANAAELRAGRLPVHENWLDRMGLGRVMLVNAPSADRGAALQQLFWNESLDRVVELPGSKPLDFFATLDARVAHDGRLLVRRETVRSAILVPWQGASFTFSNGTLVRRIRDFELIRSRGSIRVATMISGRFRDGWIGRRTTIRAWPGAVGSQPSRLAFTVSLPGTRLHAVHLRVSGAGPPRELVIRPGTEVPISFPASGSRPVRLVLQATPTFEIGSRTVALRASRPRLLAQRP